MKRIRRPRHTLAALTLAAAALWAGPVAADEARTARVVSIGGAVTEILYALGLEERIVAVDTTSIYPPEALAEKPDVGYMRALSPEGVLSVDPTLVIAEADAGPPEAVALLEEASIPFAKVAGSTTPQGVVDKIRSVASIMDAAPAGERLAAAVEADFDAVLAATAAIAPPVRVMFILSMQGGRILAAGTDTSAGAMIELAGGENALTGFSGYKPVSDEAVLEAAPEVIVMMTRAEGHAVAGDLFAHPGLAGTPAASAQRLVTFDGLYLLGFGPRTPAAIRDLAAALYPNADLPALPARPWTSAAEGSSDR